jgi:choline dehydrogenase-like flavoprotein
MFIDAREIADGTTVEADLCIVGAGAAGITIARLLSKTGISVCLLETGGLTFDWDIQDLAKGPQGAIPYYALDVCQLRYFGGNTNGWGGWCRPFDPIDFAARPWVPHSGWPFGREELEPYFEEATDVCSLKTHDWDPASWVARLGTTRARLMDFSPGTFETQVYQFSALNGGPVHFGLAWRDEIKSGPVRCLLNAHALGVHADAEARRVTHIEVGTLARNRFRVQARRFVLATGGVENARLLLLSTDAQPQGLGNAHDLVGRYFMEHPHVKRAVTALDPRAPIGFYALSFYHQGVAAKMALPAEVQEREQVLGYSANLHPLYYGHDTPGWLAFRKLVFSLTPSRNTDPYVRFAPHGLKGLNRHEVMDIVRHFPAVVAASFLQQFQPNRFVTKFILESKPEQAPNPESRVLLADERDAFGLPRARLDWRTTALDRRTVRVGETLLGRELRRMGIGRMGPPRPELNGPDEAEPSLWPKDMEGGWHQIGTTRMHNDPRQGVVDRDGRVHGIENLWVAGSSVFPTGSVAPPTLTIVALALRLARHLGAAPAPTRVASAAAPTRIPSPTPALALQRVARGIVLGLGALLALADVTWAETPFDGLYVAQAPTALAHPPAQGVCPAASFRLVVSDGEISGTVSAGGVAAALSGEVQDDGTGTIESVALFASADFTPVGYVTLTFSGRCGARTAQGERA